MLRRIMKVAGVCTLGAALAACSSSGGSSGSAKTKASSSGSSTTQSSAPSQGSSAPGAGASGSGAASLTNVTVEFTYTWKGEYAPLVYADAKGFFAKEGLKVTFQQGKGSQAVYGALGAGTDKFVIGPSGTAAQAASTGVPVVSVATFEPLTPSVLVSKSPLNSPQDLIGKKIGLRSGADASLFFSSFLKKNNIDPSKVSVTKLDSTAATAAFLTGNIQVVDAFSNNELPLMQAKVGNSLSTLSFAKFGFPILGQGVAVTKAFLQSQPDVVKRFLIAESEGIQAAKADPTDAAKVIKDREGTALPDESIVEQQVKATLDAMQPVSGHPLGWADPAAWDSMLSLFVETGQITKRLPNSTDYYSNDDLPNS